MDLNALRDGTYGHWRPLALEGRSDVFAGVCPAPSGYVLAAVSLNRFRVSDCHYNHQTMKKLKGNP